MVVLGCGCGGMFFVSTQPLALFLSLSLAEESVMLVTCER